MGCGASKEFARRQPPVAELQPAAVEVETEVRMTTTITPPRTTQTDALGDHSRLPRDDGPPLALDSHMVDGPPGESVLSALSDISTGAPLPISTGARPRRRSLRSSAGEAERGGVSDNFNCLDMPDMFQNRLLISGSPSGACEERSSSAFRPMELPQSQSASQFTRSAVSSTQDLTAIATT